MKHESALSFLAGTSPSKPKNSRTRTTRTKRKSSPAPKKKNTSLGFIETLRTTGLGRFLLTLTGILICLSVNFFISANKFDVFFILVGIELILGVIIAWILFVLHSR